MASELGKRAESQKTHRPSKTVQHSYADLRIKMNLPRQELPEVPSEVSEDEWADINRYHQLK